MIISLYCDSLI